MIYIVQVDTCRPYLSISTFHLLYAYRYTHVHTCPVPPACSTEYRTAAP